MSLYMVDVSGMVVVKRHRTIRVYADSKEEAEDKAKKTFAKMQKDSGAVVCDEGNIDLIIKLSRK